MENKNNSLNLSQEARETRRAYQAKWREKNRDHLKEYNKKYWERKARELQSDTASE